MTRSPPWSRDDIAREIERLGPWFHNMHVGGVRTAPNHFLGDYPAQKWRKVAGSLPESLAGKSVLDIGCNAGFHALEMKKRGASRVVAIDHDEFYLAQARFAADVEGLDIEFRQMSVYDVAALGERYDIVLFMGVLYHLRHPLLALDLIHEHVTSDLFVFQSMQRGSDELEEPVENASFWDQEMFDRPTYPKMHFIEKSYSDDPTNWWAPNASCSAAMLRSAGFEIIGRPESEVFVCRHVRAPEDNAAVYPSRGPAR